VTGDASRTAATLPSVTSSGKRNQGVWNDQSQFCHWHQLVTSRAIAASNAARGPVASGQRRTNQASVPTAATASRALKASTVRKLPPVAARIVWVESREIARQCSLWGFTSRLTSIPCSCQARLVSSRSQSSLIGTSTPKAST
jgi:hypothetical protein